MQFVRAKILIFLSVMAAMFVLQSCCSIVIPPVTLTGSKTAVERQIIGDQPELEKDVWMVASAKTASRVPLEFEQEEVRRRVAVENANAYEAFVILEGFQKKLQQLKADRVVGENNQGLVSNLLAEKNYTVPAAMLKKYDERNKDDLDKGLEYRTLVETVEQINKARTLLARAFIENQKKSNPQFKATEKEVLASQKQKYHDAALKGEILQNDAGVWAPK